MIRRKAVVDDKIDEIPMTPMIDVIFQLIIFFMLMPMNRTIEGRLFSQLPKDKGLMSMPVSKPEFKEVRVKLRHNKETKTTAIAIEKQPVGEVGCTVFPVQAGSEKRPQRAGDKDVWNTLSAQIKEAYDRTPSSRDPTQMAPVILDADETVPWEHVIGVVDACKKMGIDNIEFVGNPKFKDLYK